MTTMAEAENAAGGSLFPGLSGGLRTISDNQITTFTQYVRYVLPLDGYVFWLKTQSTCVQGSLHVGIDKQQREDETIAISRVIFTTGSDVQEFNAIQPNQIWVGEFGNLKFAFSRSGLRYRAAGIYHYVGDAVYPALQSQLVDVEQRLPLDTLIVSNSLPAWLALSTYNPIWLNAPNPGLELFPSFAVPDNLRPPYGVVHIGADQTRAMQAFPAFVDKTDTSQAQLATDHVRITLYGLTNEFALNFTNVVYQFSEDTNIIGMMSPPIVRDEKRTQSEMGMLAMKKTIEYDVAYNQGVMRTQARQLITKATAAISTP